MIRTPLQLTRFAPIAALLAGAALFSSDLGPTLRAQSGLPLLTAASLVYKGAFRLPRTNDEFTTYAYGGTGISYRASDNSLIVVAHDWHQWVGEVTVPTPSTASTRDALPTAAARIVPRDILAGKIGLVNPSGPNSKKIGGTYPLTDGSLLVTAFDSYDGGGDATKSHFAISASGAVTGPYLVGNAGFTSGWMLPIPPEWQSAFGAVAMTGNCCLSVIGRTSVGPSVTLFDPAVKSDQPNVKMVLGYPLDHATLGKPEAPTNLYTMSTLIRGAVFPNGTRSILFFGVDGTSSCYGGGTADRSLVGTKSPDGVEWCYDPVNTSKGNHGYPYVSRVWAYDANDLVAVKNGKKQPWEVLPYTTWTFDLPFESENRGIMGAAYDAATGRLFLSAQYGDTDGYPLIHILQVNGSGGGASAGDMTAPTVSVAAPGANATITGQVQLRASASDDVSVTSVWFTVDGTTVGAEVPTSPFQLTWDSTGVANGSHVIRAVARDAAGNVGTSAPVTVTVANTTPQQPSAPTVTITAPAPGATVTGTVTVTASVSAAVAGVRFTLDGADLGAEDTSAPYAVSWATSSATNAQHTLRAIARSSGGQTSTSGAVVVTVANASADTSNPTVSLTAPASGARLTGTVTVSASASDNVGVAGVQFTLDDAPLGAEDRTAPYAVSWNTATAANGTHRLRAIARDAAGNTRTSSTRFISVANTGATDASAPTVSVTAPAANATVTKTVSLTASAADTVGVVGVQFAVDGLNVGAEDLTAPYTVAWNTAQATNGAHVITATARDAAGNRRTSSGVTVTVRNLGTGVLSDMNGDGQADLVFEHTNGQLYVWYLTDHTLSRSEPLSPGAVNPVWRIVSRDDFNGDQKADLLWQNTATGQVYLWYLDGATMIDDAWVLTDPSAWQVATTADFNGDGKPDILWQQPATGQLAVWLMNGATLLSSTTLTPAQWDPNWRVAGAADLNRDGQADLIWQNRATGALAYWLMRGLTAATIANFTPGTTNVLWEIRAVADFNRDGQPDLLFQHATTGQMYVWYLAGTTMTGGQYLSPAQVLPDWHIVGGR
jgi:hypothetical protein